MNADVRLARAPREAPAVVMVHRSEVSGGLHVGADFRRGDGTRCFASMNWHQRLDFDAPGRGTHWVVPAVDSDALEDLATLFATWRDLPPGPVPMPFGLSRGTARVTRKGGIDLGTAIGLNCSTLVMIAFAYVGAPLLDEPTWEARDPARRREDEGVQEALAEALQQDHPAHAARLRAERGSTRYRPEEVAAASGLDPRPVDFARAEPAGRQVLLRVLGR